MSYETAPRLTPSSPNWRRFFDAWLVVARRRALARNVEMARYIVHEAGELGPYGAQRCRRCGTLLLDFAPVDASRGPRARRRGDSWGFPVGRRVIVGPTCTFLVTADRELASDEVPCV